MTIGEQIKYIRKRRGLTQTQLAEVTGIHPVTIRKYETNKLQPKKEQIKQIADTLMVSPLVFEGLDANALLMRSVGDLLGLLILMYKSNVIVVSDDVSEIKLTPVLKDHLVFMATKKSVSLADGVIRLTDAQAEQDFLTWARLYNNHMKLQEKYASDPDQQPALLEDEEQLRTIEMELVMNTEPL